MKKCNNCGSSMPDDVAVCLECGAELPVSRASGNNKGESSAQTQPNPEQIIKYQTVYVQQPAKAAPDAMGKAVTSLVISTSTGPLRPLSVCLSAFSRRYWKASPPFSVWCCASSVSSSARKRETEFLWELAEEALPRQDLSAPLSERSSAAL